MAPSFPTPPEMKRRASFHLVQAVGVPLLAVVPMLSLLGILGETRSSVETVSGDLFVEVDYPSRTRLSLPSDISITATNRGSVVLADLRLEVPLDYLDGFDVSQVVPAPSRIDLDVLVVEIGDLDPGHSTTVLIETLASGYWRHDGTLSLQAGGTSASVEVSTMVFP